MNRLGLKLACFVAAVVIWIQVASTTTTVATLQLPLEITNLPESATVAGSEDVPKSVSVRVRGSKLRVLAHSYLNRKVGRVVVDLEGFQPGGRIRYDLGPEDVFTDLDAVAILHNKSLFLDLDRVITRVVPVVVPMTGDLRDDRQLLRPMAVAPDSIVVTGPERFVTTIDSVVTPPVNLAHQDGSAQLELDVTAPSPHVTVQPDKVLVEIALARVESRTLPNIPVVALVDVGQAEVGISPPVADLMVRGPADSVRSLVPAQIRITVPAGGLAEGIHQLRGEVVLPAWLRLMAVEPEFFTVIVGRSNESAGEDDSP